MLRVRALFFILTVGLIWAFTLSTAGAEPVTDLSVLVRANEDYTTTVTYAGQISAQGELPAVVTLKVPADFALEAIWEIQPDTTDHTINPAYTVADLGDWVEYSITLKYSTALGMRFHLESAVYNPEAMGTGTMIAALEVMAPSNLKTLAIGFEAPPGYVGTGTDVAVLGSTDEGVVVYGQVFNDVAEGEVSIAQVAFVTQDRYEEATGTSKEATATLASWFRTDRLALIGLGLAVAGALALLYYLLRKQKPAGKHSKTATHKPEDRVEEFYHFDDES